MNTVSGQDNLAISYMNRFNGHCPLIGRFSATLDDEVAVLYQAKGSKTAKMVGSAESLAEALKKAKEKLLAEMDKAEMPKDAKEAFIGQLYVAKTVLAER